jgi:sporulation protein YlmC with PRC-barrel domain
VRLELGSGVSCTDGAYGELADVVIDPTTRRLAGLVVQPEGRHDLAWLVPIDLVQAGEEAGSDIALDCTIAQVDAYDPIQKAAYLRLGEFPVEDPDWDVGISDILALPYYQGGASGTLGMGMAPITYDEHVTEVYDRVPKDNVEIRRASDVFSSDGHHLGHVEGFVVDAEQHIGHLVLEHGHLWGKRDVTIPIGAVARLKSDSVTLTLSKDEVQALESVPVHRWF